MMTPIGGVPDKAEFIDNNNNNNGVVCLIIIIIIFFLNEVIHR